MSGGIFVSYRKMHNGERRVHAQTIEAVVDRLQHHFGEEKVLVDMELEPGVHYPSKLRDWLRDCEVVLVVIHREWLDDLRARRGEKWDWARWEVETALAMGLHLVPVLLDNARLPGKEQLLAEDFPGLAELGTRQYWRIGFGSWKKELAELLRALEVRVATESMPAAERPEPRPRKHFWAEMAAAVATGLAAPWVLAHSPAGQNQPQEFLVALSIAMTVVLVVWLVVVAAYFALRRLYDRYDVLFAEAGPNSKITNGLLVVGIGLLLMVLGAALSYQAVVAVVLVVAAFAFARGHRWVEVRRRERWPYPHLELRSEAVRGVLGHAGRFVAERDLLTRVERDQVEFVLGQVEWARRRMDDLGRLGRWAWLRQAESLLPAAYVLVLATMAGSAVLAVAGGAVPSYGAFLAGSVVVALLCCPVTFELAFRLRRWQRRTVVADLPARVDRVRARLAEISIPPARAGVVEDR
ncbi:hypothetical protein ADL03_30020 [Nocardia sp. NRRL S-836]|nr:hypothetical protein ADL03_30020 [Nocardia sp. NRRL S-836]